MKLLLPFTLLTILYSFSLSAKELESFESIDIPGWKKEQLSHDHLRFSRPDKPEHVIHLQVDSYDSKNHWNEKTLQADVKQMEKIRGQMSFLMGMKDYKITSARLNNNVLDLEGSYVRQGKRNILFREMNFYHKEHFLQLKLISESKLLSSEELKKIIASINPDKVEID